MFAEPPTIQIPLQTDKDGAIRVSGTRVTLDSVIACYQQSETPERIQQGFPTVSLTDMYAVISYYLAHRAEIDIYLKRRLEEAERERQQWEAAYPPKVTRAELEARLKAGKRTLDEE
jgi:uncharacterized protein (DUF433 family)